MSEGGEKEEHLTLKVHVSDSSDPSLPLQSVMLFVFKDTSAAAMVDVALKQAGMDVDPNLYCLAEVDNVTLGWGFFFFFSRPNLIFFNSFFLLLSLGDTTEERRFHDYDLPKLEGEVLWQFESEIKFVIQKKSPLVMEGPLALITKKRKQPFYVALDVVERYLACYLSVSDFSLLDAPTFCQRNHLYFPPFFSFLFFL